MTDHECVIGLRHDYDYSEFVTLNELKEHIEDNKQFLKDMPLYDLRYALVEGKMYELADYADKRKSTDLTRFDYCPFCGKKIDWKKIKEVEE